MGKHPCKLEDHQLQPRADCPKCTKGLERKPRPAYDVGGPVLLWETTQLTESAADVGGAHDCSHFRLNNHLQIPIPLPSSQTMDYVAGQYELDEIAKLEQQIAEKQAEIITNVADQQYCQSKREYLVRDLKDKEQKYLSVLQAFVESGRKDIEDVERTEKDVRAKKRELEENMAKLQKQLKKESKRQPKTTDADAEEVDKKVGKLQVPFRIKMPLWWCLTSDFKTFT